MRLVVGLADPATENSESWNVDGSYHEQCAYRFVLSATLVDRLFREIFL